MRLLRRILVILALALGIVFVVLNWVAPIALSFYAAWKAPAVARVVPVELQDLGISNGPGTDLAYFGYQLQVPWGDFDQTQTVLYPKDGPEKFWADLHFRSGLRLMVSSSPPGTWEKQLKDELNASPQIIEALIGPNNDKSDYNFVAAIHEFTPDRMNHWNVGPGMNRDEFLLMIKSIALSKSAESGVFSVKNSSLRGFQEGNPVVRPASILIDLFGDSGSCEIILNQTKYRNTQGISQPEINRIIQSIHRASKT